MRYRYSVVDSKPILHAARAGSETHARIEGAPKLRIALLPHSPDEPSGYAPLNLVLPTTEL